MGVTAELRPVNLFANSALLSAVQKLVAEIQYLASVWEDSFDGTAAVELIKNFAKGNGYIGVGDPSKNQALKGKKLEPPYYSTIPNGNEVQYTFFAAAGGSVQFVVKPDRFSNGAQICPACLGPALKKPAVAHSVIPQNIWKKLIFGSCVDFLSVVANGSLLGGAGVKSFSTMSDQKSGEPLKPIFNLDDEPNKKFLNKLLNDTSIMSTYAAQANSGMQCLRCEAGQADASLMQRLKIVLNGDLPAEFSFQKAPQTYTDTSFIGRKMIDDAISMGDADARSGVKGDNGLEEMFKRKTISQLSRYLLGIEKAMNEQYATMIKLPDDCPLLALMLDHWDEFCWCFRTRGLLEADAKYEGKI